MDNRTSVIIADNSEEFCSSLIAALQKMDGFQIMGTDLKETAKLMKKLVKCIENKDEAAAENTVVQLLSHGIDQLKSRYR